MSMNTNVMMEVREERTRQMEIWGNDHDDEHVTGDFIGLILTYLGKSINTQDILDERRRLIQVSALAIAAVERIDRLSK